MGTHDPRLKIAAEELSNRLGSEIVELLCSNTLTAAEISAALGRSIQTITYHLHRLMEAGIVRIAGYEKSQRGKNMRKYELRKPAILFIIDPANEDKRRSLRWLKRIALKRFYERILCSVLVFAVSWLVSYLAIQLMIQGRVLDESYIPPTIRIPPSWVGPSVTISLGLSVTVSFILGIIVSSITFCILSRRLMSLNTAHREWKKQ
ncbi:MAG: winged helix-turn-helix domain-containing protein [Candidatus Bathyarchaeia archaeon]